MHDDEKKPPTAYDQATADEICDRIARGRGLISICNDPGMPTYSTVRKWLKEHDFFARDYARARVDQADTYADEIVAIADTEPDPNRARVRVEARKWTASKLRPQVYGDRVDISVQGSLDLRAVLAGAEARRRRPACDQHEAGHVLDVEPAPLPADPASDCQSRVEARDVLEAIR